MHVIPGPGNRPEENDRHFETVRLQGIPAPISQVNKAGAYFLRPYFTVVGASPVTQHIGNLRANGTSELDAITRLRARSSNLKLEKQRQVLWDILFSGWWYIVMYECPRLT
jgi:hypothetical protein